MNKGSPSASQWEHRGFDIHFEFPPIPIREFDYIATDPNGEGEMIAHGETVEDCKADIDRHIEDKG